ncbi:adenylate cyclase protein (plasmid) [Rhizobium etli]|uniref:Adenylate cyclase protein n=1 Tax=Rhizobium etli TaxID=29449 RepID=A0AAN1BPC1_RHIET|nr:adenylate/guanylate cyclase domain-containing protein [Rhizobium etli]ARQ14462.1 adenylate cyclase protein [Rhizobium etli]
MQRRLAAILVADVVGYSRLVEKDEGKTLVALRLLQNTLLQPQIAKHAGRVVKLMGDGFIAEFASVVEAVSCAIKMQNAVASHQDSSDTVGNIVFRIGINIGDVVVDGDDLLGDGVNVAARLEQICPPGDVLISGAAYEHLGGKIDATIEYAGEQQLKNISRPIKAYHVPLSGSTFVSPKALTLSGPTIAVLPFENMSGDPEQVYFSDGITADIITELARFAELMVIARTSSFALRGRATDLREVGRLLGAGYIVEGSVRRAGNRVRITVQLVETVGGTHLWADRYDRSIEDIFATQEEIAQSIVAMVAQRVIDNNELTSRRRRLEDMRAYDLFLQGNRLSDDFRPGAQERAEALFERAAQTDPSFARAHTGLAYIYLNRASDGDIGIPRDRDENRIKALRSAETAFALDPSDPRVQCTLGYICLTWRDFKRAEHHLDLAKTMNPNDATILILWAWMQGTLGRSGQGLAAAEMAYRLNPLYPSWYNYYKSRLLFLLGRYNEAALLLEQRTFDTPDREPRDMAWRAASYAYLDRLGDAEKCAGVFLKAVSTRWSGDEAAGAADYVNWLVDVSYLSEERDVSRLRDGLRRAGLPA